MFHVKHSHDISSFVLKVIAIVGMTCNHVANVFAGALPAGVDVALYSLGGATFPIMSFMLAEGFAQTSNIKKYAGRLFGFAVVSQIPYSLLWGAMPNVLFTLLVGLGVLYANKKIESQAKFTAIFLAACIGTIPFDWGCVGIVVIYLFDALRGRKRKVRVASAILVAFVAVFPSAIAELLGYGGAHIVQNTIYQAGLLVANIGEIGYSTIGFGLAALLLCRYRGRRGRSLKWLFYGYYPAHLAVIWAIAQTFAV